MSDRHYGIKYTIESGRFRGTNLAASGAGGCDAIMLVSILKPEWGGVGYLLVSKDGQTDLPLSGPEIFGIFGYLAKVLGHDLDVPDWQKWIAKQTFEAIRNRIVTAHPG